MRPTHHGDDLGDDYVPDSDLVVVSGDEKHESDEDDGIYEELHSIKDSEAPTPTQVDTSISKKRKRREKEKLNKAKAKQGDIQSSTCHLSSVEAALYLSTQQAKALPKLSVLELEDIKISASCIADTTSYTGSHSLYDIGNFISQNFPQLMLRLSQKPRNNGAPTLIFVAGAALRVADVTRVLRRFRGDKGGEIAKLFARHFKLQEHVTYLRRTKVGVAVGTPARLGQLLDAEALVLTALTHIFLDTTYCDAKKRSMMDIPETRDEVFRAILGNQSIRAALRSGKIQLVLF